MTAMDVANAIRSQNLDAPAGQIGQPPAPRGQPFQLPIDTLGRLTDPEQFGDIIVKVGQRAAAGVRGRRRGDGADSATAATARRRQHESDSVEQRRRRGSSTSSSATTAARPQRHDDQRSSGTTAAGTHHDRSARRRRHDGRRNTAAADTTAADEHRRRHDQRRGTRSGRTAASTISSGRTSAREERVWAARRWAAAPAFRRPPSSASATWPASSWAPRTTTSPAPSTASPSVGLSVYQLPGTNALDVADPVRKKMEELKTRFPDGVDYDIAYDTTPFIRESVHDVVTTLLEAVVLVGLVVLVFLQDWRAMILPMIDVPSR